MKYPILLLLALIVLATGCLKEDTPVDMPDPGETVTLTVNMGADYKHQIWFDLGTESVVKTALKTDWDISFNSKTGDDHIYVNTGKLMKAAKASAEFENVTTASGLNMRADDNTGNPDSLAFSGWQVGDVFVIDRGYTETGALVGTVKLQITGLDNGVLSFRYAQLDGSDERSGQITKNETYNVVAYSFTNHQQLYAEPPKADWDLAFTQYTFIFYEPDYTPYLVTGVFSNAHGVTVAEDQTKNFVDITVDDVANFTFSPVRDVIGYDWKVYDFDIASYRISSEINYIIKDAEGTYYKLHFIDFYDNNGLKGAPKFTMQRL